MNKINNCDTYWFSKFMAAALLAVTIVSVVPQASKAQTAKGDEQATVLDSIAFKLSWIDYRIGMEEWQRQQTGRSDSLRFYRQLRQTVLGDQQAYDYLRRQWSQPGEDLDRRSFDLIYPAVVRTHIDQSGAVSGTHDSLSAYYARPWSKLDGKSISFSEADGIISRSRRGSDREDAYRAISYPDERIKQQLASLFRLRNQAARRMGYNDFLSLSADLARFEINDYLTLIDAVDSVTRRPYERVANELKTSMGEDPLEVWDWDQRFERTMTQVDRLFPADSQFIFIKRLMAGIGIDLLNLPIYWQRKNTQLAPGEAIAIIVAPSHDARIVWNAADGLTSFQNLLQAVGLALTGILTVQESDLFSRSIEPAWTQAVSTMFARLGSQPGWLTSAAATADGLQTRWARAETAMHLLKIRLLLVQAKFEYEAYRQSNQNLNQLYWDIFEEYTGLPRHDDLAPWAGRSEFLTQPLHFYYQLQGVVNAAQNYRYLGKQYGRLVNNREIGSFLTHNYFRHGARYGWQDLLERATGEPLNIDYLATR